VGWRLVDTGRVSLTRLQISNVRNLQAIKLDKLQRVNVFYGPNGSGKTSVLEAIHILGMARSFRGTSIKSLISHNQDSCTVYGLASSRLANIPQTIGVQRMRSGASRIRVAGKPVASVSQLVEHLPLQVINSSSFDLLTGPPAARRQFLNWGVFHVEHRFFGEWQRFQRCIKQRNMLLRRGKISAGELPGWTRDLSQSGFAINSFRQGYIKQLVPRFQGIMKALMPYLADDLELRYLQGWDKALDYVQALENSLPSDLDHGYTHLGPQRADIKVLIGGHSAAETLSRGQQKLVVSGLKLAQGMVMADTNRGTCTYLVDDLPSELDDDHCKRVCEILSSMDAQVFITCVDKSDIAPFWPKRDNLGMFLVEHGVISPAGRDPSGISENKTYTGSVE
jgi:DNA replication and repair protein RecF